MHKCKILKQGKYSYQAHFMKVSPLQCWVVKIKRNFVFIMSVLSNMMTTKVKMEMLKTWGEKRGWKGIQSKTSRWIIKEI